VDIVSSLKVPVLGLYGGSDDSISLASIEQMKKTLKEAGNPSEIVVYPNTAHGFHADYRPTYRKEQAEDGDKRLQAWFKKYGVS
jgi:carboxymethylenebutenolidase